MRSMYGLTWHVPCVRSYTIAWCNCGHPPACCARVLQTQYRIIANRPRALHLRFSVRLSSGPEPSFKR